MDKHKSVRHPEGEGDGKATEGGVEFEQIFKRKRIEQRGALSILPLGAMELCCCYDMKIFSICVGQLRFS